MHNLLETGWSAIPQAPFTRAELFDAVAYGANAHALRWLLERFEVIARPMELVTSPLQRGDILLRRAEGAGAHACVILDPEFRNAVEVALAGGTVEIGAAGNFVFVAETGARPHGEHEQFARRVTDHSGRVLGRQLVLRPIESAGEAERVDPVSLMVGMTIANMGARPRETTRIEVVAPKAEPLGLWEESEFTNEGESEADPVGRAPIKTPSRATPRRFTLPASCGHHARKNSGHGESAEGDESSSAEFNSPEHFRLGSTVQRMVNNWAKHGIVSGGCFVIDSEADGRPKPFAQWQFFVPDRSTPLLPYGDKRLPENAHWHWITPHAHNDSNGRLWTPKALATALAEGRALTLSVGDLVLMSGDIVGEFSDYAAASSSDWRKTEVNIGLGLRPNNIEPFAFTMLRLLQFPQSGIDRVDDMVLLARASTESAAVIREIQSDDVTWKTIRELIKFVRKVAGTRGYHQLLVLSRLMRTKHITVESIQRVAPWISSIDPSVLLGVGPRIGFGINSQIDTEAFQMIVTNGHYAELAMTNERHFAPSNWGAFEHAHVDALQAVDRQATLPAGGFEHGPVPADAIARLAYGLHFQTDAFAAGHMRVPRKAMGRSGTLMAGVMHDFENEIGLIVENGFNERWRAFGDGYLDTATTAQSNLLRKQHATSTSVTPRLDPRTTANRGRASNAVLAAVKQLHYQAMRHYASPKLNPKFREILRVSRGVQMQLLWDETVPGATPGDPTGNRDSWIAMNIKAKIEYLRNHKPVPIASSPLWTLGRGNHLPLVQVDKDNGRIVFESSRKYSINQHLVSDRVLYDLNLANADEFQVDISKFMLMAYLAPESAVRWAGTRETYLQLAFRFFWGDDRNSRDDILRWALGRAMGRRLP